ncbi:M67 family metallopeptidase [Methylosoma difficile]
MQLSRKLTNQLLHLAQLSADVEICGLVSAQNGLPLRCYPIKNIAENPQQRFLFDPSEHIAALKTMRDQQEQPFAIFHSHPSAPAQPSATDIAESAYPELFNLIISLNTKGVLEMRGFAINGKTVEEIELTLTED